MARRGPQPKNPATRQRRNAELVSVPGERIDLTGDYPKVKPPLLAVTKQGWDAFWQSEVAAAVRPKDIATLTRLFQLRNMHERLFRVVNADPLLDGSRGQPVLNPAAALMTKLMAEIRALEREFGLTPDAGARMVSSAASAERSVRDLMKAGDDDDRPVVVAVDSDTGS